MKILVLTNLYPPHHAGTFDLRCESVTENLRRRGHEVRVLTSTYGISNEQRDAEVERRLVLHGAFGCSKGSGLRSLRRVEAHNHRILQETITAFAPDLIHVWSLHGLNKSLVFALRNSQLPTVYDVSDWWIAEGLRNDPWLRWWNAPAPRAGSRLWRAVLEFSGQRRRWDRMTPTRLTRGYDRVPELYGEGAAVEPNSIGAFRFDRIYFCSEFLKSRTEQAGFRVAHADVIRPGIQTELYCGEVKPLGAPVKKFLFVGKLTETCGAITALHALKQAGANGVKVSLSIYGRGESDYIAPLRSFAVLQQLPVEFLTVSNVNKDLATVYRQHDAFLYTSETLDPFATTPLEAMAAGLPVIGTRTGGMAEFLRHGENAFTYTAGDALELASRIQELQTQPALRHHIATSGQSEVLTNYNETIVTDHIEDYLTSSPENWQHT